MIFSSFVKIVSSIIGRETALKLLFETAQTFGQHLSYKKEQHTVVSEREKEFVPCRSCHWWNSVCIYPLTLLVALSLESLRIKRLHRSAKTSVHLVCGLLVHCRDLPSNLHQAFAFKAGSLPEGNEYPWQFLGWRVRAKRGKKHCDRDKTCGIVFVLSWWAPPSFSCEWELSMP